MRIEGIGKIESINISPSILGLLSGKIIIHAVTAVKPEFTYTNPALAKPSSEENFQAAKAQPSNTKQEIPPIIFHRLCVKNGVLSYIDQGVCPETGGITITLANINMTVANTYEFPAEIITKFSLSAEVPWNDSLEKGTVKLEGWMNYGRKDMRAFLEVKDIDALYLAPYYSGWFNLDKMNVQKAKLAFTSNITSLNNDVTATCHLELTEVSFKQHQAGAEQSRSERIAQKVIQFFQAINSGKVQLDFSIKTKMDSPEFGLNCIKNAFYNTLNQARSEQGSTASKVMKVPGQVVGGTVKSVGDVSSALIGGLADVGREIGKSLKASFTREGPVSANNSESATVASEYKPDIAPRQIPGLSPANETHNNTTN